MSSSSSQRFENLENAVDHIERKLDRVSVKVKEVIKYLNEKVSDRNSKHGMILDEMKKMSEVRRNSKKQKETLFFFRLWYPV